MRGKLISVEGLDGAGKTLLAESLGQRLRQLGYPVRVIREPGGTSLSEKIRAILLDRESSAMAPGTEAFLYLAARAQLVAEVIVPALEAGQLIICDRFVDSTLAYQGGGRGLDPEALVGFNRLATGGIKPDLTILLDVEPLLGRQRRLASRGANEEDRLEAEALPFYQRVRQAYLEIARQEPERVRVVAAERPPAQVLEETWKHVKEVLAAYESERSVSG